MITSAEWYIKWQNALVEIERISKDLDLSVAENDKDRIQLDSNRLDNALKVADFFKQNYLQAKQDEETGLDSTGGLTYIGRSDYGY